jgi:hypothetical protein
MAVQILNHAVVIGDIDLMRMTETALILMNAVKCWMYVSKSVQIQTGHSFVGVETATGCILMGMRAKMSMSAWRMVARVIFQGKYARTWQALSIVLVPLAPRILTALAELQMIVLHTLASMTLYVLTVWPCLSVLVRRVTADHCVKKKSTNVPQTLVRITALVLTRLIVLNVIVLLVMKKLFVREKQTSAIRCRVLTVQHVMISI